jgi:hypothetical protein
MVDNGINMGLDLLMNKKKRASSSASSYASSIKGDGNKRESVIKIDDDRVSIRSASVKSHRAHKETVVKKEKEKVKEKEKKKKPKKPPTPTDSDVSDSDDDTSTLSSASSSSSSISSSGTYSSDSPVAPGHKRSSSSKTYSTMSSMSTVNHNRKLTQEDILNMKKELLYQFDRLEKKGVRMPKKFTMASSLEEMKMEFERVKTDREVDISVKFQRKMMMAIITGVEFMNNKFDPFDIRLDGWSETVNEGLNDYDDIFEELHDKYKGKAKMAPEVKLMFTLFGSAFMFHLTNTMFKSSSMPGLEQVMKQNPDLMKQFAAATMNTMAGNGASTAPQQQRNGGGGGGLGGLGGLMGGLMGNGGIGSLVGSLFGGGGMGGMSAPPPGHRPQMRGPTNVDDILNELNGGGQQPRGQPPTSSSSSRQAQQAQQAYDDRVETMSTVSESELSEMPDDASTSGVFVLKNKGNGKGRTLNIK